MADYKQMYLTLLDATEKAINELISAQRACEELYILSDGGKIVMQNGYAVFVRSRFCYIIFCCGRFVSSLYGSHPIYCKGRPSNTEAILYIRR